MSTKTIKQRISLVAALALGASVISASPAFATSYDLETGLAAAGTNTGLTVSMPGLTSGTGATYSLVCNDGTPATSTTPRVIAVGGTSSIKVIKELAADDVTGGQLRITGPAKWIGGTLGGVSGTSELNFNVGAMAAGGAADEAYYANFQVTGTGTIVISAYASSTDQTLVANASGKPTTHYVSGTTSCGSGPSADKSFAQVTLGDDEYFTLAQIATGRSTGTYTQTSTLSAGVMTNSQDETSVIANGASAYIQVNANDPQGYPFTTTSTVTAQCTNNATVEGTAGGYAVNTSFAGFWSITVAKPTINVPLTTTCTVSRNGVVFATKTIKFLGDAATIALSLRSSGYSAGSSNATNDGRFRYFVYDSAGNEITEPNAPAITTAATTAMINTITAVTASVGANDGYNQTYGEGRYNCLDYGTQDFSIKMTTAALGSITSNVIKAPCAGDINSFTASFDKAQYQTGDIATLTITAKDKAGNASWQGATIGGAANGSMAIAVGGMTAVTTPATSDANTTRNSGVWTYSYKVDTTAGSYVAQVLLPVAETTSAQLSKPTLIQYKIVSSSTGVTNEEVLKSIVALIASINKQIQALQKLILKR